MTNAAWDAVLTDLATRCELAERCLDEGGELDLTFIQSWTPPQGLGPLPKDLLERAVSITARQTQVQNRLEAARTKLSSELAGSSRAVSKNASMYAEKDIPKYFDSAV